jgi:sec-independent protein translocase protein TatC
LKGEGDKQKTSMENFTQTFTTQIIELRKRFLYSIFAVGILLIIFLPFSNFLYHFLAEPLLKQLPHTSTFIATDITAPFFVPLKFSTLLAITAAIPFLLYQGWSFILPALYRRERRMIWPLLFASVFLFYLGMCFAYFLVFPLLFQFFIHTTPKNVAIFPDISSYLDVSLQLLLAFGLAFEVPVGIVLLSLSGVVTIERLSQMRRYFIVAAFIVAMLLTPPDVMSQSLLAIPLCLLFEIGLLAARFFKLN